MGIQYYIRHRGVVRGPFDAERLQELARRHQFGRHYELSRDGETWESAANHPELLPAPRLVKVRKTQQAAAAAAEAGYELAEPADEAGAVGHDGGELQLEPASAGGDQSWYYAVGGEEYGPVPLAELRSLIAEGQVEYDDIVWTAGLGNWVEVSNVPGLLPEEAVADPAAWQAARQAEAAGDPLADPLAEPEPQARPGPPLSPLAIASWVSGLLGLPTCSLAGIPAVILGHMALRQIARSRGALSGRGLGLAGLIMGYASIGIAIVVLLVMILAAVIRMLSGTGEPG